MLVAVLLSIAVQTAVVPKDAPPPQQPAAQAQAAAKMDAPSRNPNPAQIDCVFPPISFPSPVNEAVGVTRLTAVSLSKLPF